MFLFRRNNNVIQRTMILTFLPLKIRTKKEKPKLLFNMIIKPIRIYFFKGQVTTCPY